MRVLTWLGARIIFGALLIFVFVNMLGAGGPLSNLTGLLISRFPFHRQIAGVFAESLGYEIGFIPETSLSVLDDLIVLLIAVVISGGISTTLAHIFSPDGENPVQGIFAWALSSVVTVCVASFLFGGLAQRLNGSFGGRVLFPILKAAALVVLVLIFVLFVRACAGLANGEVGLGLLLFFAIRAIFSTVLWDVLGIYLMLRIVNEAESVAMPLAIAWVVLNLVAFVAVSLGRGGSSD